MRVQTFSKRPHSALAPSRICFASFWRKPAFHRFLGEPNATRFFTARKPTKTHKNPQFFQVAKHVVQHSHFKEVALLPL